MFRLAKDNESRSNSMYKGRVLPWTLWDGKSVWGFHATRGEAVIEMEGLILDAKAEVESFEGRLDDAKDWLAELVTSDIT